MREQEVDQRHLEYIHSHFNSYDVVNIRRHPFKTERYFVKITPKYGSNRVLSASFDLQGYEPDELEVSGEENPASG